MKKKSSQKLFDLSNKVIILTGSGGRLGTNFAHTLADAGADLVLIDLDRQWVIESDKFHSKSNWFVLHCG